MKPHWNKKIQFTLLASIVLGLTTQSSFSAEAVSLAMDDRPPFHYQDENGHLLGGAYLKVKCIFEVMGLPLNISILPWKRAQIQTKQGKFDGFFAASRNATRDKYAILSNPITDQYWNWYFLKEQLPHSASSIPKEGYKISSWLGSNSYKWLEDNGYKPVAPSMSSKELATSLFEGNVDVIFGSNIVIESQLATHPDKLKVTKIKGLSKPMGVYFLHEFLKSNDSFLTKFNAANLQCSK